MKLRVINGIMLTLYLISVLTLEFNIPTAKTVPGTIYVRSDGSVEPHAAPILSTDNITYTFMDNIFEPIVVERDNIVVDGAGCTLQGVGVWYSVGVDLSDRKNVTVKNVNIKAFGYGVDLWHSSNNKVLGNKITDNVFYGINLGHNCSSIIITGNIIANNEIGIKLEVSSNITIAENTIKDNDIGILLYYASNNLIHSNKFKDNLENVYLEINGENFWDDGYPSGGNYWSDYTDVDQYKGPYQNETGSDGFWDHPYIIDENNQDNYPRIPEFPFWTSILPLFIVLAIASIIFTRKLHKKPY